MTARPGSYQYNFHRAMSIIVRTFLVVFVLGFARSYMTKPIYQCTTKIFLESGEGQQTIIDSSNPLSGLFSNQLYTIPNQLEMLQGDKVASDAYINSDVP